MRYVIGLVMAMMIGLMPLAAVKAADQNTELRDAKEVSVRGGLPNFFAKLKDGKTVKIAYLGGSITAQSGWRIFSREMFQKQFPASKVSEINAAIGGTGSDLGVFRLKHDVLTHKPDMMFVEFAVNDAGAAPDKIHKAMEGIVRQTWKELPDCDICFVYTITERDMKTLGEGKMKRSASAMEQVADFYDIPSIHMGIEVADLVKRNKVVMKAEKAPMTRVSGDELNQTAQMATDKDGRIAFSKDGVHPYTDTGHKFYIAAISRAMKEIEKVGKVGNHECGKAMVSDNWEAAKMLPLSDAILSGFTKLDADNTMVKRFGNRLPGLWEAKSGAILKFKFKGSKMAVYDLVGPDGGVLEVMIDGKKKEVKRIDGYCTYHRLAVLSVADNLPDTEHSVEIKVLDTKLDKSKILFERNLGDMTKNPDKYAGIVWYVGGIFIIGEPVK